MLKYVKGTRNLTTTLRAEDMKVCWYVDASFMVHHDYKSHTHAAMILKKGAIQGILQKQELNTKSSTEAKVVGADDTVNPALWTKQFLEAQGHEVEVILYQDNTSAILLEKNGKESSSKRTRHLNIRYFFIKDCIDKKLLRVEYCPTDDMIGDFPSKPLQGRKFKKHCKAMMNSHE